MTSAFYRRAVVACSTGISFLLLLSSCEHVAIPGIGSLGTTVQAEGDTQPKMDNSAVDAANWQSIARHEAQLLTQRFEEPLSLSLSEHSFRDPERTDFERAYGDFLVGGLIDRGYQIFADETGYPIEYDLLVLTPNLPDSDVVVTTRIRTNGQVLYSHSSVYQLSTDRRALYEGPARFSVRGPVNF